MNSRDKREAAAVAGVFGSVLAVIGWQIRAAFRDAARQAAEERARRNGTLPPRWTDKNRWE